MQPFLLLFSLFSAILVEKVKKGEIAVSDFYENYAVTAGEKHGTLQPVLCGRQDCPPGHSYGPAVRPYFLIHYIIDGGGIFRHDGMEEHASAGDIFVIDPYRETYYRADDIRPWRYIWIGFLAEGALPCPLSCGVHHAPEAAEPFRRMTECRRFENGRSAFLTGCLYDMFARLSESSAKPEPDYVEQAIAVFRAEYMRPLTVGAVAERLGFNRSYFSALFRKKIGVSPKDYLTSVRMQAAVDLLLRHGKTPTVAACSCGYDNIFLFSKAFKQYYGLSPREYVKANKTK